MSKLDHVVSLTSSDAASKQKATLQQRTTTRKSINTGYNVLFLRRKVASLHWMDKMKKFRKASQLQSTTKSLDTLTVEMAAPVVTASAMREMHHFKPNRRKLQLIDSFHRYARSSCGCRFPESREPQGHTLSEARRLRKVQRESQFAQHVSVFDAFLSSGGVVSWRL